MRSPTRRRARRRSRATRVAGLAALCSGLAALSWMVASPTPAAAQGATVREYEIKAAFLFKFIEYIDWPAPQGPTADPAITLCVIGTDPFGAALNPLRGKVVKGRTLRIEQVTATDEIASCQILFVSPSEEARLPSILASVEDRTVLSVSEIEGFARRGGIINFIAERNRVRFEINPQAARRNQLTISSELLKLARLVEP